MEVSAEKRAERQRGEAHMQSESHKGCDGRNVARHKKSFLLLLPARANDMFCWSFFVYMC